MKNVTVISSLLDIKLFSLNCLQRYCCFSLLDFSTAFKKMKNNDNRMYEGNTSDINHLGGSKAEKKLDVKVKCFIRVHTQYPVIAFVTSAAMNEPLNNLDMITGFVAGFVNGINNTV